MSLMLIFTLLHIRRSGGRKTLLFRLQAQRSCRLSLQSLGIIG